jgi:hypothetical protein
MQHGAARIVTLFGAFESTLENTPGLNRNTSGRQRFLVPWLKRVSRDEARRRLLVVDTPQRVVERKDGKAGSRRALRRRTGSRRGRRGRSVLQETRFWERLMVNVGIVLGVPSEVPEAISFRTA